MTLPELFPISGDALRNWLNTAGQSIILSFDTGASCLRYIREQGMAIRDSDLYDIYHAVWDRYDRASAYGYLSGNELIPLHDTITDHGWNLGSNFLYRFHVSGTNPETGGPAEGDFAIASMRQLTPNEAADYLGDLMVGEEVFYEIADMSYTLTGSYAKPGLW